MKCFCSSSGVGDGFFWAANFYMEYQMWGFYKNFWIWKMSFSEVIEISDARNVIF